MRKIFFIACVLFATKAMAEGSCGENCVPAPKCEDLGYQLAVNATCVDGYVMCPFDSNYVWCRQYECKDGGLSVEAEPKEGKVCVPTKFHGLDCYDCSQDKVCHWTSYNSGKKSGYAELIGECQSGSGTYQDCVVKYEKILNDNQGAVLTLPEHAVAVDYENITVCGETISIYKGWKCEEGYRENKTSKNSSYEINLGSIMKDDTGTYEISCKECLTSCSGEEYEHPEGFVFKPDSDGSSCGTCVAKQCPSGLKKESELSCETEFVASVDYAGNEPCGQCKATVEESTACVEPYVWDSDDKDCKCKGKGDFALDDDGHCACNQGMFPYSDTEVPTNATPLTTGKKCEDDTGLHYEDFACNEGFKRNTKKACVCDAANKFIPSESVIQVCRILGGAIKGHQCLILNEHKLYDIKEYGVEPKCYKFNDTTFTCDTGYSKSGENCVCDTANKYYTSPSDACSDKSGELKGGKCLKEHRLYDFDSSTGCYKVTDSYTCDNQNNFYNTNKEACLAYNSSGVIENDKCFVESKHKYYNLEKDNDCYKLLDNSYTCDKSYYYLTSAPANARFPNWAEECAKVIAAGGAPSGCDRCKENGTWYYHDFVCEDGYKLNSDETACVSESGGTGPTGECKHWNKDCCPDKCSTSTNQLTMPCVCNG